MTLNDIILEGERLLTCYHTIIDNTYNTMKDVIVDEERDNLVSWVHAGLAYMEEYHPKSCDIDFFHSTVMYEYLGKDTIKRLLAIIKDFAFVDDFKDTPDYDTILDDIFTNFHVFICQLKHRHDNRPTIEVKDEYDIQDLMEAVLRIHFQDVRAEEWCPSYAGGSKRMDFYLKDYNNAIETKMTRDGLTAKQLGEQLLIDIPNYKQHPNCETLYCFVYDPDGRIRNPNGLIKDLQNIDKEINIKVIIKPIYLCPN